ncbi:hypothetical protein BGZ61DRAFT_481128 [Ilyonectria robusta]|uniref:uncharacterized protein n=1 Tax=Ilyonectria robusta TaxID=1079257 RepID=UPI001E8E58BA|nr:uncharacterized protein BGZ61DRAFT_481128 [Ilyonectria robusta]KAH8680438.1 hypothetical protein BGZ61DRAFT_481128 [Ilyonectria robusta]
MDYPNLPNLQLDPGSDSMTDTELETFPILTSYLSATSQPTASEAAKQINSLFPSHRGNGEANKSPEGFLAAFWDLMFRVAIQLDYQTQSMHKFVSLIKALRDLPNTTALKDGRRLWQDLPDLALFLTERWHQADILSHNTLPETDRRWKNLNGLVAYLTNERLYGGLYRALESIGMGIENSGGKEAQRIVECFAPAAAVWFNLSSPQIYHACKENALDDSRSRGKLWKGKPGYSLERWGFWRSRLVQLRNSPLTSDELRGDYLAAEASMDRVTE